MNKRNHSAEAVALDMTAVLRHMTPEAFSQLGVNEVAYVRRVKVSGDWAYAIHAADGTPLGVAPERRIAYAAIREHEMEPQSLH